MKHAFTVIEGTALTSAGIWLTHNPEKVLTVLGIIYTTIRIVQALRGKRGED